MSSVISAPRSTFVTVLGCILLALCVISLVSAVLQVVFVGSLLQAPDMEVPGAAVSALGGLWLVYFGMVGFVTYAAVAFLRRQNWARRTFIVLFALSLALNILSLAVAGLGMTFASSILSAASGVPAELTSVFSTIFIVYLVFAIGLSVLYVWIIRRLRSPAVRAEFGAAPAQ